MSKEQNSKSPFRILFIVCVLLFLAAITALFVILLETDSTGGINEAVDPALLNDSGTSIHDRNTVETLSSTGEVPSQDEYADTSVITANSHNAAVSEPSIEQEVESDRETPSNLSILEGKAFAFGAPRKNIKVWLTYLTGSLYVAGEKYTTSSDVDGHYCFEGLPHGSYLLHWAYYCDDGMFSDSSVIDIDRKIVERDLHIAETVFSEIRGNVFEDTLPCPGIRISLNGGCFHCMKITDESGEFRFARVPPGYITLEASYPSESRDYRKAYSLKGGSSISERIIFRNGGGSISGRILVDDTPQGIGWIQVTQITSPGTAALSEIAGIHSGDWLVEGLPEGEYAVTLSSSRKVTKHALVSGGEETKVDFHLRMGDASIKGFVLASGVDLDRHNLKVYLFFPDTCAWKKGDTFRLPTTLDGLFAEAGLKTGNRFVFERLRANTFDLVAIYLANGRIEKITKERVEVLQGDDLRLNMQLP